MAAGRPRIEVRLDADVKARVEATLTSPLAGGIPFGAISDWCGEAIAFRSDCVELTTERGRLWCDRQVWEWLQTFLPAGVKLPTAGIDHSAGF
jgi:hypothetical protein